MKKPKLHALVAVTVVFAAFTFGFLLGRSSCPGGVTLAVPGAVETRAAVKEAVLPDSPVDLNTADKEALMALPGIGEVLAQRILDYRAQNGPFKTVEALMLIEGIGEKKVEKIIGKISIGG